MIVPTLPEPLCDVAAQFRALCDPAHPKDAMWVSRGTPLPPRRDRIGTVVLSDGVLLSVDPAKIAALKAAPNGETLAAVLGYAEPKSHIDGVPAVVQAVDDRGCVIMEMGASVDRLSEAVEIAQRHGTVAIVSLEEALMRRARLCALEA